MPLHGDADIDTIKADTEMLIKGSPRGAHPFLNSSLADSGCVREDLAQLPAAEMLIALQHSKTHTELKVSLETETKFWVST